MAINATFFITRAGIYHIPMSQHGTPFVWYVKKVSMAFQALFIFEGSVGPSPGFLVVVLPSKEMHYDILNSVGCLCVEKIKRIMGRGQMAIHAVGYKTLPIVNVR